MNGYQEPKKVSSTMSFFTGAPQHIMNFPPPTRDQVEAAKDLVFREPDAEQLGLMIFGEPV